MPRDTIQRAINKGAGIGDDAVNYDTVTYEGFAPHKVPLIIECLTDNKNRTASDIRVLFRKEGQLGAIGSVAWMFDRVGEIEASKPGQVDFEADAIEAGAQDVEGLEKEEVEEGQTGARFFTDPADLDVVNKGLVERGWIVSKSELGYRPKSFVDLGEAEQQEVQKFLQNIDDNDDVHRVYAGIK